MMIETGPHSKYFYHPGSELYGTKPYVTACFREFDSGIGDSATSSISVPGEKDLYHAVNIEELQYQRHGPPSFPPPRVPLYAMYQQHEDVYDPELSTFECSQFDSEVCNDVSRMFEVSQPFQYGSFIPSSSQLPNAHRRDLMDSCDYLLPNDKAKVGLKLIEDVKIFSPLSESHLASGTEADRDDCTYLPCKSLPNLQRRDVTPCGCQCRNEDKTAGQQQPQQSSLPCVLEKSNNIGPRMGVYPLYTSENSMTVGYADGSRGYSQSRPKTLMKKKTAVAQDPYQMDF